MKVVQLRCSRCDAVMIPDRHAGYTGLSCPYCGNARLLMESDAVKLAQLHTASELTGMEYRYREHLDRLDYARSRRKAQTVVICVFALIALILTCIYLA